MGGHFPGRAAWEGEWGLAPISLGLSCQAQCQILAKTSLGLPSPMQLPPCFGPELAAHCCCASLGQRPSPELRSCLRFPGPTNCMGWWGRVGRCRGVQGKVSQWDPDQPEPCPVLGSARRLWVAANRPGGPGSLSTMGQAPVLPSPFSAWLPLPHHTGALTMPFGPSTRVLCSHSSGFCFPPQRLHGEVCAWQTLPESIL